MRCDGYRLLVSWDKTPVSEIWHCSISYANLTVKIKRPVQGGPGQNLMTDPEDPTKTLYTGNTINRQSSHSLRIGGASALAAAGSSDREIMILGRWKSLVFLNYVRSSQLSSSRSMKLIVDPRSFTTLDIHRLSKRWWFPRARRTSGFWCFPGVSPGSRPFIIQTQWEHTSFPFLALLCVTLTPYEQTSGEVHYGANPIRVRYYKEVGSPPVFFTTEQNTTVSSFPVVRSSVGRKLGF